MLLRSAALLVVLVTQFGDLHARSDACQVVDIDTEQIKGQCCVHYKNNVKNPHDLRRIAAGAINGGMENFRPKGRPSDGEMVRPFSGTRSGPEAASDNPEDYRKVLRAEVKPRDRVDDRNERPRIDKVNRNYHNRTDGNETAVGGADVGNEGEAENVTVPDVGNRNNVDVPETCTKGYSKDKNGNCVEIFD